MKFRPCIDLHNGVVKQIVGSTLSEDASKAPEENFVATKPAAQYAEQYKNDKLLGGHIIMLGPNCEVAALAAVKAYPSGMQIGGGINCDNAMLYLDAGASHVIVTSFVFKDGEVNMAALKALRGLVGKERIVIDLSCRKKKGQDGEEGLYYVVTNKWTQYTNYAITPENLITLAEYCDEFLVHGVDVEGRKCGIEEPLVVLLGQHCPLPVTYAGGIRSVEDLELVKRLGNDKVDCTVGSALDMFGGSLPYADVLAWHNSML
mmetsp:Transcript_12572/g.12199  ORF Transcript_12572/g.12199 Transcript_12572/m.12199 type:complete len:261 (+) Transcript_12572:70-852(+)